MIKIFGPGWFGGVTVFFVFSKWPLMVILVRLSQVRVNDWPRLRMERGIRDKLYS